MIETKFLKNLLETFPNGYVSQPLLGASYIYDRKSNIIGYFDYRFTKFYLNSEYEYLKEAKHALNEHGIDFEQRQMENDMIDKLYSEPNK